MEFFPVNFLHIIDSSTFKNPSMHVYFQKHFQGLEIFFAYLQTFKDPWEPRYKLFYHHKFFSTKVMYLPM